MTEPVDPVAFERAVTAKWVSVPDWRLRDLELAEERLKLARGAVVGLGYFTPEQVSDDVAPRIIELWSQRSWPVSPEMLARAIVTEFASCMIPVFAYDADLELVDNEVRVIDVPAHNARKLADRTWLEARARKVLQRLGVDREEEQESDDPTEDPLDAEVVAAIGLDPTGRDGDPRFPYTMGALDLEERKRLMAVLQYAFSVAGGRGVELAEMIDRLTALMEIEQSYEVGWTIEVTADSATDAADQSWAMLQDAASANGTATMLVVRLAGSGQKVAVFDMETGRPRKVRA